MELPGRSVPTMIVGGLLFWAVGFTLLLLVHVWNRPVDRAFAIMTVGILVLWVGGMGMFSVLARSRLRETIGRRVTRRPATFVAASTLLALIEEAVTTGMTNAAPLFGVPVGAAYVTASSDYLDVVLGHSVVVFVPMFVAWALLLERYRFSPFAVLLLFGTTGLLAEVVSFGPLALVNAGFWIMVYGLMVYLPATVVYPVEREAGSEVASPKLRHCVLAVVLPLLAAVPVALVVTWLHPTRIHF